MESKLGSMQSCLLSIRKRRLVRGKRAPSNKQILGFSALIDPFEWSCIVAIVMFNKPHDFQLYCSVAKVLQKKSEVQKAGLRVALEYKMRLKAKSGGRQIKASVDQREPVVSEQQFRARKSD